MGAAVRHGLRVVRSPPMCGSRLSAFRQFDSCRLIQYTSRGLSASPLGFEPKARRFDSCLVFQSARLRARYQNITDILSEHQKPRTAVHRILRFSHEAEKWRSEELSPPCCGTRFNSEFTTPSQLAAEQMVRRNAHDRSNYLCALSSFYFTKK